MDKKTLEKLVNDYGANNNQKNELVKWCNETGPIIKQYFKEQNLDVVETDTMVAKVSLQNKNQMDEEKLIEILLANGGKKAIKKKEYVDMTVLESLIYNGKIDAKTLAPASTTITTAVLKVTKKKEVKNG